MSYQPSLPVINDHCCIIMFNLKELVQWLRMTPVELWFHVLSVLVFSILLTLKCDGFLTDISWRNVFMPLFICDAFCAYFCTIVFVRQYMSGNVKMAVKRLMVTSLTLVPLFIFKFSVYMKLSGQSAMSVFQITMPLFILLQIVIVQACAVRN